ncbi:MAG: cyclic nucleotide-binding domain-containing protein [Deltaproteobacteria bacterium]|nr:cyclic nucleotide-binding domain-containing protein [Deltaproteobacteria bacterium]
MKPKKAVREHEKALKRDPENLNIRIKLAGALQQCGRTDEAAQMYLSVARSYRDKGRLGQATAVCKSVLEIVPGNQETKDLLAAIDPAAAESKASPDEQSEPNEGFEEQRPSGRFSQPLLTPTPLPDPVALHEVAEETIIDPDPSQAARPAGDGVKVVFKSPPPLEPVDAQKEPKHEGFKPKKVRAQVSFKRSKKRRSGRIPRNRAAEAAAELAKDLETETQGRAISPKLPQALTEIASGMQLKHFPRGEMILREGDPGNALYLIVSGQCRVLKRDAHNPDGDLIEVATLGEGEIFGEFAILADFRRHATVQSVADSNVYEIPRELVDELTLTYPEMAEHLEGFYRERLLNSLLDTSRFFQPLAPDTRKEILKLFQPKRVEPEAMIIREGELPTAFYIVLLGEVDVLKATGPQSMTVVSTLTEGDHFASSALMRGVESASTVMARGPTELAKLSLKDFYRVVGANPVLWDQLRTDAKQRDELLAAVG